MWGVYTPWSAVIRCDVLMVHWAPGSLLLFCCLEMMLIKGRDYVTFIYQQHQGTSVQ